MTPFRKGGSFVRFFIDGTIDSPESDDFLVKLAEQRFRTIESAANEDMSVGWVSPSDPSGQDFLQDEIVIPPFVRLRMRIDRKKLPAAWLAIHLSAEIRARAGQKISAKERKDIKADIADRVLPRVLPTVQFVDVILVPERKTVLLFSTSQTVIAECAKLFLRTWDVRLIEADPTTVALRASLGDDEQRRLEQISPFSLAFRNGTNGHASNGNGNGNGNNGNGNRRRETTEELQRIAESADESPAPPPPPTPPPEPQPEVATPETDTETVHEEEATA